MKTLVAFSGGLDSIYVLWKQLTETNDDITAVFYTGEKITDEMRQKFDVINVENKMFGDSRWVHIQKIAYAMMEHTRPFNLFKESYDPSLINEQDQYFNHGAAFRAAMAVRRINNNEYDKFVAGVCRDNDGYQINRHGFVKNETASSLMTKYFIQSAKRGEISLPLLEMKYTTANAFAELPSWLVAMNRSCQMTIFSNITTCKQCYKCMMHEYAYVLLDQGKTVDEIYDIYTQKSVMSDGTWRSQKVWIAEEVTCNLPSKVDKLPMPEWGHSYKVSE